MYEDNVKSFSDGRSDTAIEREQAELNLLPEMPWGLFEGEAENDEI